MLKVVDGSLKKGDRVVAASTEETYDVLEVSTRLISVTLCTCLSRGLSRGLSLGLSLSHSLGLTRAHSLLTYILQYAL